MPGKHRLLPTTQNVLKYLNPDSSSDLYWTSITYDPTSSTVNAFDFNFDNGFQRFDSKSILLRAWAVRDGDVTSVPVPGAFWLLGSSLIGLISVFSKRK